MQTFITETRDANGLLVTRTRDHYESDASGNLVLCWRDIEQYAYESKESSAPKPDTPRRIRL